ncbi:aminopeptidase N [Malaclemys terrapin pileata]|uniref:aminopeptidase N n=1 Tax=Malaclemys terrapin pileata TaxID=2991368 RepID=UPI0023A7EF12|nr:aminopeptidase N [Malaclemys terrapin pileata]XP_053898786.1 aminopeptidase N [Malaclemys terrapin pileata]XP_053898787.1 aminopeptidase N [Malaclemys terrapin pileata]XP_053898789.1 aminopeptidase N [Malaclemys terrapin pileata]
MAAGFFISKTLGIVGMILGLGAVATIIALSVVYSQEKEKNAETLLPSISSTPANVTSTPPLATTAAPANPWNNFRLPQSLIPEHYAVTLQPFLTPDASGLYIFKGNSTVSFSCQSATDLILLHSKQLNYTEQNGFLVSLQGVSGSSPPPITKTWLETQTQYLVVQLQGQLEKGKSYELVSSFTGELADDLAGFYRSEYVEDGVTRVVATTQMQAPDARKAFPCFDEPAMKANFTVTLIHSPSHTALSNMPVQSSVQQTIDGTTWNITKFETTPKMSTYLLAFIVSQFEAVEAMQDKVLIRIWGRPKAIADGQGDYALNVTGPILKFFENHYNTSYPLPKSDQVALPDFNAGAMENWGLVTYRENSLLYDPLFSSIGNKERVVTVIAHELAHQWFGNLVTLRWWNDLWLNEGFASYVEYLGADSAEPSWNIKDLIVQSEMYRVMKVDALASSHPLSFLENEINTPAQISEVFDAIAYSKGASVLRMLSEFLTEDSFKKGLQSYLQAFSYGNTVYDDLWTHLQKVVDEEKIQLPTTIKGVMDRWTLQMGFPVVTVDTKAGSISQRHFLLDTESIVERPSAFNYTWIVPVTWMKQQDGAEQMYWLTETSAINSSFVVTGASNWLLLNINVTGYFRVNYDQDNWNKLLTELGTNHEAIPVINRAQIIDDAFNLARAKHISITLALNTTTYLDKEREYLPWSAALDNLGYFRLMFDRSEVYGPMQKYIRNQVTPLFQYFGNMTSNWTRLPDGLMEQYNEINAISTACSQGVPECTQLAAAFFNQWKQNPSNNPIPPNLRSSIYCSAIETGSEADWDFLWQMFKNATVVAEADKLRSALACSKEPWILKRYLQYCLDPSKIRKQDATSTINSIASNVVGQSLAWDFIRGNWKTLFSQYGGGSFSFSGLIQVVTQRFASEFELQQLEQFKADNADVGFGSGTRALEQALEKTKANIKWVAENKQTVLTWFETASS